MAEPLPDGVGGAVQTLSFSLLTEESMREVGGGFEVTSTALEKAKAPVPNGLSSPMLGTDSRARCGVCALPPELCRGHMGSIPLNCSTWHPWFVGTAQRILKGICYWCATPLLGESACPQCGGIQPAYAVVKDEVRCTWLPAQVATLDEAERAEARRFSPERARQLLRASPAARMEGMVMSRVVAPPLLIRPTIRNHGNSAPIARDQQTLTLIEVVRAAMRASGRSTEVRKTLRLLLESNGEGDRRGAKAASVRARITSKAGLLRRHVQGKRVDLSARSVIVPDPSLRLDEVGLPRRIAEGLVVEERVFGANLAKMRRLREEGAVLWIRRGGTRRMRTADVRVGDTIARSLRSGDVVCLNRQPTLHRPSFRAFRARVHKRWDVEAMGLPLQSCEGFNAGAWGRPMGRPETRPHPFRSRRL